MDSEIRRGLNWGSGPARAAVRSDVLWWDSDIVDYGHAHVGSILDGLPWEDGFFDGIVANHSLQALTVHEVPVALAEMKRLLRPGGRLRVLVPDVMGAVHAHYYQENDWPGFAAISEPWVLDRKLAHYLTWGGQNRSTFVGETLFEILGEAGFHDVRRRGDQMAFGTRAIEDDAEWVWLRALDSRQGESEIFETVRP